MKLIRKEETQGTIGYVAEEPVFEAMIRLRRTVIPLWTTATVFFLAALVVLLTILKPMVISSTYVFSLFVGTVALSISAYVSIASLDERI
jgi:hypothetical protein